MKETRQRRMVFSNVKSNKKKADEKSASKDNEIFDYDNEIVIGLKVIPEPKIEKNKKNKNSMNKRNSNNDELDIPFQKDEKKNKRKNKNKKVKTQLSEKQKQKIAKRKKIIIRCTKITTLALVLIAGLIFCLLSPIFNIETINVSGNSQISTESIKALSKINIGDNIFKIRKSETIKNIQQNAYIENVQVSKKLCNTIEVTVKERYATYMILLGNGYIYLNNQGYILEISNEKMDAPIINGYSTAIEELQPGNRLNVEDLNRLEMVLKIKEAAQSNDIAELITEVDISNENEYKVTFGNEDKIAYLGDCSVLSTRLLYVKAMLEQEEGNAGEIFVNMDLNSENPFFREKV